MIERGSLVKLVKMEYEYNTGFYNPWKNGLVGVVTKYTRVVNVNNNRVTILCNLKLLVPYLSAKNNPINFMVAVDERNLEEVVRQPITRKSITKGE